MSESMAISDGVNQARRIFFEEGRLPDGLVNDIVLKSWQRCTREGRKVSDIVVFNRMQRDEISILLERNRRLISAAEMVILRLAKAVKGTGYNIALTDNSGMCIANGPAEDKRHMMFRAFLPGVDLSEQAIGTNAMSAAMTEGRVLGIFGQEHFFMQNQHLQCVAAPVFGPEGTLLGSIDISRDAPSVGPQFGAVSLMLDSAAAIEASLLLQIPAHLIVCLNWHTEALGRTSGALIAFGADGEILATNRAARQLCGIESPSGLLRRYEDFFLGGYTAFMESIRMANRPVQLMLQSGLQLFALALPAGRAETVHSRPLRDVIVGTGMPEFGDAGVQQSMARSARALGAGLPILIQGETGTGKEVAARALHAGSAAARGPFVAINCGAIPRDLIEGELFGYADGAYTGARRGGAKGKIEEADGGTLFLDEIGDMPLDLQTRLLRVLESREVTRLGESTPRRLTIQVLSATHQDLDTLVAEHRFRNDLFFRLNGMRLYLPPLRQRSDLPALIDTVLRDENMEPGRIAPQSRTLLEQHQWPGNVRELRTALRFARAMTDAYETILPEHLPDAITDVSAQHGRCAVVSPAPALPRIAPPSKQLKELESDMIGRALAEASGNISRAARQLGISRSTLHRWMNKNK